MTPNIYGEPFLLPPSRARLLPRRCKKYGTSFHVVQSDTDNGAPEMAKTISLGDSMYDRMRVRASMRETIPRDKSGGNSNHTAQI